jgi:hypothetical protein
LLPCRALVPLVVFAFLCSGCASFKGWGHYGNAVYNYWLYLPPGFSTVAENANGTGGIAKSAKGNAILIIWGQPVEGGRFQTNVLRALHADRVHGWAVAAPRYQGTDADWTGSKGKRVFHARAIYTCGRVMAFYRLEYDRSADGTYAPIIAKLDSSFDEGACTLGFTLIDFR